MEGNIFFENSGPAKCQDFPAKESGSYYGVATRLPVPRRDAVKLRNQE
jgi:hypothetical protein